jgi:hypothetical protein
VKSSFIISCSPPHPSLVLRFTREELLALYRPTKCPPEICGLAEISTLEPLEPECRNVFDHEEVSSHHSSLFTLISLSSTGFKALACG